MTKSCINCQVQFEISDDDQSFYNRMNAPLPSFCNHCRQQRRFAWRNERFLYKRKCDFSGESIISIYSPATASAGSRYGGNKPLKVYSPKVWWSDDWDAMDYARDFDFSRSFFEQFEELMKVVPHISLWNWQSENSEYTHCSYANKNCYMHYCTDHSEDSFYNYISDSLKDCIDCTAVWEGELLIECIDCEKLYGSRFCQNCKSSNNLDFCLDCIGCSDCFLCTNLRNKKYCYKNEQLSKEEYEEKYKNLFLDTNLIGHYKKELEQLSKITPRRENKIINSENCLGNYITDSKNAYYCFDIWNAEDVKYCTYIASDVKDVYDSYAATKINNCLEVMSGEGLNDSKYINWINNGPHSSEYCILCVNNCRNLFGCVGLKNKQYCIFNKQYRKEEYFDLRDKIIEYMKSTCEYGEFFPMSISPFGYNETIASEYYPLSKEEAVGKGYRWKEGSPSDKVTKDHRDKGILMCEITGKAFRVIPQERCLYEKLKVNSPTKCPDQRHLERIKKRNPRTLWIRKCNKCNQQIWSSYSLDSEYMVYCEECYDKEIY